MAFLHEVFRNSFRPALSRQLYEESQDIHLLGIGAVLMVLFLFWSPATAAFLVPWAVTMALLLLWPLRKSRRYGSELPEHRAWEWTRQYLVLYLLISLGWGMSAVGLMATLTTWQEVALALLLFTVVATPILVLSSFWPLVVVSAVCTLIPAWLSLLIEQDGNRSDLYVGLLMPAAAAVIVAQGRRLAVRRIAAVDADLELVGVRDRIRQAGAEISVLQNTDPVSGALRIPAALEIFKRHADREDLLCIYAVQLDGLEDVLISHGREHVDGVLRLAAVRLQQTSAQVLAVARDTGGHFIVLATLESDVEAERFAETVRRAAESARNIAAESPAMDVAVGFAVHAKPGDDFMTMVDDAIFALRTATLDERRIAPFAAGRKTHAQRQVSMRTELSGALERDELSLHLQPKVDLQSGEVISAEALLRWNSRVFGNVSPVEFIPIAESSGLIMDIGKWVIEEASRILQRNRFGGDFRLAVNVSAVQFTAPDFINVVGEAACDCWSRDGRLEIEVTESVVLADPGKIALFLESIKTMDVSVALDDFGTGYSSLGYLNSLPFDVLKLDRTFLRNVLDSDRQRVLVESVISLATGLGMKLVAEGVETKEHMEWLRNAGCTIGQGYFYSKPLPEKEFGEWLETYRLEMKKAA